MMDMIKRKDKKCFAFHVSFHLGLSYLSYFLFHDFVRGS